MNTTLSSNVNGRGKLIMGYLNADGTARPEDFVVVRARRGMPHDQALAETAKALKAARLEKYLADRKAAAEGTVVKAEPKRRVSAKTKKAAKQAVRQRGMRVAYADGTIWYRADRKLWIAQMGGRQIAARPSAETCIRFLAKFYPDVKPIVLSH